MPYAPVYTPEPTRPSGGPQPGSRILYDAIDDVYFPATVGLGIYNPRDICGNLWPHWRCKGSQHAAGRAGDHGVPLTAAGRTLGTNACLWLTTNSRALGIQECIFYERRWTNQTRVWQRYSGRDDHRTHLHWAQTAVAAATLSRAQVEAVAPSRPPTPISVIAKDDDMAHTLISPTSKQMWLIEPGAMTLIPEVDRDNHKSLPALGTVSATYFQRVDEGHVRYEK